jgi:serine/threonine-protein kinase
VTRILKPGEPPALDAHAIATALVGEVVAGKYRIDELIAAGGMGIVFAATHLTLRTRVAVKVLRGLADEAAVKRFLREARAAAMIDSEHVARVLDCGTAEGIPYMVIEHLSGRDLAAELKHRGPLPACEAVDLLAEALEGIAAAHALGIIHRDLKPSNLFLADRPGGRRIVKVLDFGVSKLAAESSEILTHAEAALGSPGYMAPEQARDARSVDARADVWSLGVILYQMLAGKRLFCGDTLAEVLTRILFEPLPSFAELPPRLDAVVGRCLERDVARRYADVGSLAHALVPFASAAGRAVLERVPHVLGSDAPPTLETLRPTPPLPTEATVGGTVTTSAPKRRRRARAWALGATLGSVLCLAVSALIHSRAARLEIATRGLAAVGTGAQAPVPLPAPLPIVTPATPAAASDRSDSAAPWPSRPPPGRARPRAAPRRGILDTSD